MKKNNNTSGDDRLREEIDIHIDECSECSDKADALEQIVGSLGEHRDVFHPSSENLYEYAQDGIDPLGNIALHLEDCEVCRKEIEAFKACAAEPDMPETVKGVFEFHLGKGTDDIPVAEPESGFSKLVESITSLFNVKILSGLAVAATAALLVFFVYPRGDVETMMGLSSVTWEKKPGLTWMTPGQQEPFKRPRVALVLFLNGFEGPVPQDTIDALYTVLKPGKRMRNRFEVLTPREVGKSLTTGNVKPDDHRAMIERLRSDLKASHVATVTLYREGKRYDIRADLIDSSNGSVLKKSGEPDLKGSDLPLKLREAVVGLLK